MLRALLLLGTVLGTARASFQDPTPAPTVAYTIRARVEDPDKRLVGDLEVVWRNRADAPTRELWFHLYLNAFANDRSTHLTESRFAPTRALELTSGFGWQRILQVEVDGEDVTGTLRYRSPDDGRAEDASVATVEMPREVAPGESVSVRLSWESQLPRVRRRTGIKGDFILGAQWFPKLGVFEGQRGWNCHQFHAGTEFYADFGTFDVTLDLPERYAGKVFGSGLVEKREVRDQRSITTIVAPSTADRARGDVSRAPLRVHDFAWTADPRYEPRAATFEPASWIARFPDEVEFARRALGAREHELRDVAVTVLIHPEREAQWRRHFEATCAALFFYGLWWGAYPYEHITVIDPAWGADAAGGMEYPTLFTCGTTLFTRPSMHRPESVTVHECGHQFWYGLVANNEFESSWMDEGFNTFSTSETLMRAFGPRVEFTEYAGFFLDGVETVPRLGASPFDDALALRSVGLGSRKLKPLRANGWLDLWRDQPHWTLARQVDDPRWSERTRYLSDPDRDPIDTFAWLYADLGSSRVNSYQRTAISLRSMPAAIEHEFGRDDARELFLRGMRGYADRFRFGHPRPDDFFATFSEQSGVDMAWYFEQVFRSRATVDWRIVVTQKPAKEPRGWFQSDPSSPFEERKALEDLNGSKKRDERHHARVQVIRRGELILPVPILLRYDDGSSERVLWTREQQARCAWLTIERVGARKLVAAAVDPDRGYQFDADMSNNQWHEQADALAPWRSFERAFALIAQRLHAHGGVGG